METSLSLGWSGLERLPKEVTIELYSKNGEELVGGGGVGRRV